MVDTLVNYTNYSLRGTESTGTRAAACRQKDTDTKGCVNYIGAFAAIVPSPRSCCAQNVHTRDVNADQAAQELRELRSRLAVYAAAIFHHQKHGKRILENANCFHHQKHGKKIASGDVKKL